MAGGEGCRNERRGSSASEVGTVDGTAKKKEEKKTMYVTHSHKISSQAHKSRPVVLPLCIHL